MHYDLLRYKAAATRNLLPDRCTLVVYRSSIVLSRNLTMLWTIFVVLLVLWLVGLVSFHAIGAYIHILLVLAIVVLLIQLITGRRAAL